VKRESIVVVVVVAVVVAAFDNNVGKTIVITGSLIRLFTTQLLQHRQCDESVRQNEMRSTLCLLHSRVGGFFVVSCLHSQRIISYV
jgi:hypothetical protein